MSVNQSLRAKRNNPFIRCLVAIVLFAPVLTYFEWLGCAPCYGQSNSDFKFETLISGLPPLKKIVEMAEKHNVTMGIYGGTVRDLYLKHPFTIISDCDLIYNSSEPGFAEFRDEVLAFVRTIKGKMPTPDFHFDLSDLAVETKRQHLYHKEGITATKVGVLRDNTILDPTGFGLHDLRNRIFRYYPEDRDRIELHNLGRFIRDLVRLKEFSRDQRSVKLLCSSLEFFSNDNQARKEIFEVVKKCKKDLATEGFISFPELINPLRNDIRRLHNDETDKLSPYFPVDMFVADLFRCVTQADDMESMREALRTVGVGVFLKKIGLEREADLFMNSALGRKELFKIFQFPGFQAQRRQKGENLLQQWESVLRKYNYRVLFDMLSSEFAPESREQTYLKNRRDDFLATSTYQMLNPLDDYRDTILGFLDADFNLKILPKEKVMKSLDWFLTTYLPYGAITLEEIIRFPESSCVIGLATGPVAASFSLRRLKPATTNGFTGKRITPPKTEKIANFETATKVKLYLLKKWGEMWRAQSDRPLGMRAACQGRANSLRMPKGGDVQQGDVQQGSCPPLLRRYVKFDISRNLHRGYSSEILAIDRLEPHSFRDLDAYLKVQTGSELEPLYLNNRTALAYFMSDEAQTCTIVKALGFQRIYRVNACGFGRRNITLMGYNPKTDRVLLVQSGFYSDEQLLNHQARGYFVRRKLANGSPESVFVLRQTKALFPHQTEFIQFLKDLREPVFCFFAGFTNPLKKLLVEPRNVKIGDMALLVGNFQGKNGLKGPLALGLSGFGASYGSFPAKVAAILQQFGLQTVVFVGTGGGITPPKGRMPENYRDDTHFSGISGVTQRFDWVAPNSVCLAPSFVTSESDAVSIENKAGLLSVGRPMVSGLHATVQTPLWETRSHVRELAERSIQSVDCELYYLAKCISSAKIPIAFYALINITDFPASDKNPENDKKGAISVENSTEQYEAVQAAISKIVEHLSDQNFGK